MKLSFSLSSKPSSKSNPKPTSFNQEDDRHTTHEYVTEFDPSKTLTDKRQSTLVIPPIENTWRSVKKMKNLDLPIQASSTDDPDLRFELEAPTTAGDTDSSISYGLTLRKKENESNTVVDDKKNDADADADDNDNSAKSGIADSIENVMLKKFKEDMKNLPEDRGFDEFIDCPVEGFGKALLAGYGWKEGQGIGRNAKEDVKVVQYVRRAGREGLGYEPDVNDTKKKGRNSGPQLVAPKGPDGRTRHVVGIDEKLVPREEANSVVGKVVRIVGGRHVGLKGKVVGKLGDDSKSSSTVVLMLLRSGEEVTVREDEVAELSSVKEENYLRKLQEAKVRGSKDDRRHDERRDSSSSRGSGKKDEGIADRRNNKKRIREGERGSEIKHDNGESHRREKERNEPVSWLTSHIRVRIVSKDFRGGKLYLKKGEIVDVVGPKTCDISIDESRELIQGVKQDILETAIPRRGGPVLVLYGKHKGVFGNLVERDMEKETGVVRDADSHALLNVRLEQIAEYLGDPSYIGY
ncbi:G-patch domain [Macleaya cordata]|uniref:G-patch domain n=1 Tax=Macleaya cordata TaxID=56857 RepID=A0A200RB68_MACCD|nr:G-patch domain [Macleaya cordata]